MYPQSCNLPFCVMAAFLFPKLRSISQFVQQAMKIHDYLRTSLPFHLAIR